MAARKTTTTKKIFRGATRPPKAFPSPKQVRDQEKNQFIDKKRQKIIKPQSLDDFDELKEIAMGSYSTVYAGTFNKKEYAIKVMQNASMSDFGQEIDIGKLAKQNVVLNTVIPAIHHVFQDNGLNMVMDLVAGKTLESLIRSAKPNVRIATCLVLARQVETLHKHGVVHLDIKPNNIIYNTYTGNLMLVDLGFGCIKNDHDTKCMSQLKGSPDFMSPELYSISYHKSLKIVDHWEFATANDVWATAMVMMLILNGGYPIYKRRHRPITRSGVRLKPLEHRTGDRNVDYMINWLEEHVFKSNTRPTSSELAEGFDYAIGKHHAPSKRRRKHV